MISQMTNLCSRDGNYLRRLGIGGETEDRGSGDVAFLLSIICSPFLNFLPSGAFLPHIVDEKKDKEEK